MTEMSEVSTNGHKERIGELRAKAHIEPEDRLNSATRAKIRGARLTLAEEAEVTRSLGGVLCNCPIPWPLGPAGLCERCGAEGPFRSQVIAEMTAKGKITSLADSEIASQYTPVNWAQAWAQETEAIEWLVEPVLEKGTINALFGKPGHGKSLVTLHMVLTLVRQDMTVLMIDDENRVRDLVDRLKAFGAHPEELTRLIVFSFAGLPPLDTVPGGMHLAALADKYQPVLVTLDTTSRLVAGEENSANTFLQLYRCTLVPLKGRGITVLRLDHPGKDASRGQRGSSAKEGDVDTVWRLTKESEEILVLEREKSRSGHGDPMVIMEKLSDPLRFNWDAGSSLVTGQVIAIARYLDKYEVPLEWGRDRAEQVLTEHNVGARHEHVSMALKYRREQAKTSVPDSLGTGDRSRYEAEREWY